MLCMATGKPAHLGCKFLLDVYYKAWCSEPQILKKVRICVSDRISHITRLCLCVKWRWLCTTVCGCWRHFVYKYGVLTARGCPKRRTSLYRILYSWFRASWLYINPYPTAFPYGNGMVLHFYQQQESSRTKTVHKVINKGLKTYV